LVWVLGGENRWRSKKKIEERWGIGSSAVEKLRVLKRS